MATPITASSEVIMKSSDSSINASMENSAASTAPYIVYKRRWFLLLVIVLLNTSNAMIWITFSPIADTAVPYYGIDAFRLNILVLVFAIASVPFGFLASWLLDTLGLRFSLIVAGWLNGIGSLLRNISTLDVIPQDSRYTVCLIGQIMASCAQPFVMFAPTKMAALWFPSSQRATANMMASMANPIGILVANLLVPSVVNKQSDIPTALWIISGPAFLVMLMATFGVCGSVPPTPPTASAAEESEPFFQGLKKIIKIRRYWVLNIVVGTGLGIFTALSSFLDQILCPRGYTDNFAGICGALMIGAGALGAIAAGIYVDKTKRFEEVVKVCWSLAVLFGIGFTQVSRYREHHVLVALSVGLFGCFGFAIYPICLELLVEVTYPIAEATSSGLAVISGQVQSIIYILMMQVIAQDLSDYDKQFSSCAPGNTKYNGFSPQDWTVPNLFMNGLAVLSLLILMLFFKAEYRRLLAEQRIEAERILHLEKEFQT